MTKSTLISGTLITNNCSSPRNRAIDTITPHYMDAYVSAKACCESFLPRSRQASANYCIGYEGEIWCNVEEQNRAWTSGNSVNDNRAITIECANYTYITNNGVLPTATWNSLVNLCVDICKRYGKKKLVYTGSASWSALKSTEMLLTKHKWFQDTDCPGPWLDKKFGDLAREVNKILNGGKPTPITPTVIGGLYKCNVDVLNVRNAPTIQGTQVVAEYHRGAVVQLDDWYVSEDGFIWGRYKGQTSGKYRYVAIGKDTGKPEKDDYLIKV